MFSQKNEDRPLYPYEVEAARLEQIRACLKTGQPFRIPLDKLDREAAAFEEVQERMREARSVFNPRRKHFIN